MLARHIVCYHVVARDIRLSLLLRNRWLLREKYAELSCIDCCSLAQFAKTIFNGVFVESLIQGNFTAKVQCATRYAIVIISVLAYIMFIVVVSGMQLTIA